jgi:hypothetical protein
MRYNSSKSRRSRVLRALAFALPAVAVGVAIIEYIKEAWR